MNYSLLTTTTEYVNMEQQQQQQLVSRTATPSHGVDLAHSKKTYSFYAPDNILTLYQTLQKSPLFLSQEEVLAGRGRAWLHQQIASLPAAATNQLARPFVSVQELLACNCYVLREILSMIVGQRQGQGQGQGQRQRTTRPMTYDAILAEVSPNPRPPKVATTLRVESFPKKVVESFPKDGGVGVAAEEKIQNMEILIAQQIQQRKAEEEMMFPFASPDRLLGLGFSGTDNNNNNNNNNKRKSSSPSIRILEDWDLAGGGRGRGDGGGDGEEGAEDLNKKMVEELLDVVVVVPDTDGVFSSQQQHEPEPDAAIKKGVHWSSSSSS